MNNFHKLNIPMPPMLPEMVGIKSNARYFSICYYGSKATWSTGISFATFSYFSVYRPLITHIALALELEPFYLGSDDELPTHSILFDREKNKIYVGEYRQVEEFLTAQYPPIEPVQLTDEELEQLKAQIEAEFGSYDEAKLQKLGMFELFIPPSQSQHQDTIALITWLDKFINDALIDQYIQAANQGSSAAFEAISILRNRLNLSQKLN